MNRWFGWQVLQKVFSLLGSHFVNQLRKAVHAEGAAQSWMQTNRLTPAVILIDTLLLTLAMPPDLLALTVPARA